MSKRKGGFTLPGEAGYEKLTLELADKWGADVIRDSDGTVLSDEITNAGYGIYSTICIIRDHNAWAKENQDKLQQSAVRHRNHTAYLSAPVFQCLQSLLKLLLFHFVKGSLYSYNSLRNSCSCHCASHDFIRILQTFMGVKYFLFTL